VTRFPIGGPTRKGVRLFYQIASRLAIVAAIFAVLQVGIVVAMYVNDEESLSEDLVSLESRRIVESIGQRGVHPDDEKLLMGSTTRAFVIFDDSGNRLEVVNPGNVPLPDAPLADVQSTTSREMHGKQFFLTGVRRVELGGRPGWIGLAASGEGLRPFVPALFKEVRDHALLPLIPLSMLLLFFNVAVVRRMLKPLERAVAEADALDPSDPSRRLHQPASPVEVSFLLMAVNRALDRVERAIHALRQFTADVAHELRTPLASMTLTIERLPSSAERQKLEGDAASMSRLIGQMLDLARTDALEDMRQHRCDLHEIASRVATDLAPVAVKSGRSIRYRNEGSMTVEGRAELLERAVRNLIENALTHTPPGTEVEVIVGPGREIKVRDHGDGIPVELRSAVFERFWRAHRQRGGAGLGLAITRKIMEACGGRVQIDDAANGGAVVGLSFPTPTEGES
jgi:two-component system OmpR family sensor kinase